MGSLRLLAAEGTSHSRGDAHNLALTQAEAMRDLRLDLAGVLRRRINRKRPVLTRNSQSCLSFEVEVFLPTRAKAALNGVRRACESRVDFASNDSPRRAQEVAGGDRVIDRRNDWEGFELEAHGFARQAQDGTALSCEGNDRLTGVATFRRCQKL